MLRSEEISDGMQNESKWICCPQCGSKTRVKVYEETVLSAHRDLPELIRFLGDLEASGEKAVILAVAGLSAALPGVVVMSCSLPVIGVPVPGGPLNGIDALLAIAQCPGGVPCTTVGLHKKTPVNAAMAAHRILKLAGL
jgi:5-(carboxyamino)imidazole ribonucleotide mutase